MLRCFRGLVGLLELFCQWKFFSNDSPWPQTGPLEKYPGLSMPLELQNPVLIAGVFTAAPTGLKASQSQVFLYGLHRVIQ